MQVEYSSIIWKKYFGLSPEYSQKVSPERTTTILKLADTLKANKEANDPINDPINLFDLIKENPKLSYEEYGSKLGVSAATIKRKLAELKATGKIVRKGSKKTGYWEVKVK